MSDDLVWVPRERWGTMHPETGPFKKNGIVVILFGDNDDEPLYGLPASVYEWRSDATYPIPAAAIPPGSTAEWADGVKLPEPSPDPRDAEIAALRTALKNVIDAVDVLVNDSVGVAGLHANGDVAPWSDLMRGGYCEDWLRAVADARDVLDKLENRK